MINAILDLFFTTKKEDVKKCITVVKRRESKVKKIITKRINDREVLNSVFCETCLSRRFSNIKGLNVKERAYYFAR